MRQRVNLALALTLEPKLVLLDEPTTGLDVLVQRTILDNIRELQASQGFAVIFVSHDLGTVLETSDRIMIMYRGSAGRGQHRPSGCSDGPEHPYSRSLLDSYLETFEHPGPSRRELVEKAVQPDVVTLTDVTEGLHPTAGLPHHPHRRRRRRQLLPAGRRGDRRWSAPAAAARAPWPR